MVFQVREGGEVSDVDVLVWRVRYSEHSEHTTLAMVKGLPLAIMLTGDPVRHDSQELGSAAEAEEFLLTATQSSGAELVLPPTEFVAAPLPFVGVEDDEFKMWAEKVLWAVEREILSRQIASVKLTWGKPVPAFTR